MTSKEVLKELMEDHYKSHYPLGGFSYLSEGIEQLEKDLEILEKLKKVLSKVAYTPEIIYGKEDENGFIPVNCEYKVTCGEEFDIALFKNLIDQLGFELVKEETESK